MTENNALAQAIFESKKTKRHIAQRAKVEYTRFSKILHGRGLPTETEKRNISRVLRQPISKLFPDSVAA